MMPSPLPLAGGVPEGRGGSEAATELAHPGPASRTCPSREREGKLQNHRTRNVPVTTVKH